MRAGFGQFNTPGREFLRFAAQYGVKDVLLNTPQLPDAGGKWAVNDLVKLRLQIESEGLKLMALENVPTHFYLEIMLGGPNRERQIENMIETVRNIGAAGIPMFGYNWMPSHVWRTEPSLIRAGALATAFDNDEAQKMPYTHRQGTYRRGDVGAVGRVDTNHYAGSRGSGGALRHSSLRPASGETRWHPATVPIV